MKTVQQPLSVLLSAHLFSDRLPEKRPHHYLSEIYSSNCSPSHVLLAVRPQLFVVASSLESTKPHSILLVCVVIPFSNMASRHPIVSFQYL